MNGHDDLLAGRYRLQEKIASGGSAYIYRAYDEKNARIVAVKILKPDMTGSDDFIGRFKKEVQASLKLRHANIIRAYDAGLDGSRYYIVMDLVEGTTLKHLIQTKGPLPIKYVVNVAKKLCLALEYAHVKGFIHRDIKPHNILVDEAGEPYIADFGIARSIASNTITADENSVMGSVHYFSPEQARGERVDKRTDIYSLGILIYEMLTGQVPFDADTSIAIALKHINEPMPPLTSEDSQIPESLNRIIQKATQKDKHFRYKTPFNMYEDLMRALSDTDGEYVKYTESKRSRQHIEGMQVQPKKKDAPHPEGSRRVTIILASIAAAAVALFLLLGPMRPAPLVRVPALAGYSAQEAKDALRNAGLEPNVLGEASDQTPGTVVRQSPAVGDSAKPGSTVDVYVSEGGGGVSVPNVTGIPIDRAKAALDSAGLPYVIIEETQGTYSIGYVMEQNPIPGTPASEVATITLTVKVSPLGYPITAPNVVGKTPADAVAVLKNAGFSTFFTYSTEEPGDTQKDVVFKQAPAPDSEQMSGQPISLYVLEAPLPQYRYAGDVTIRAEQDETSVRVGIVQDLGGISAYRIIADTMVQAGTHNIELGTVGLASSDSSVAANMVIILNDAVAREWQVELVKVDP